MIFVPALITLKKKKKKIYNFDTETINLTIGAIALFLGTITGISNASYYKKGE